MEPFDIRSDAACSLEECATLLVATVPQAMSLIRKDVRSHRPAEISIPQFRTLTYLRRHPGASISSLAEHLGLALSTTSQLIDGLMQRDYVTRNIGAADRRRAVVSLTNGGRKMLEAVYANARALMAARLATLTEEERRVIGTAMQILQRTYETSETAEREQ